MAKCRTIQNIEYLNNHGTAPVYKVMMSEGLEITLSSKTRFQKSGRSIAGAVFLMLVLTSKSTSACCKSLVFLLLGPQVQEL